MLKDFWNIFIYIFMGFLGYVISIGAPIAILALGVFFSPWFFLLELIAIPLSTTIVYILAD